MVKNEHEGQWRCGYVTRTKLPDGELVHYGLFSTIEEAQGWVENLIDSTEIVAVYYPTHSRG